jgi:hypothetical protein
MPYLMNHGDQAISTQAHTGITVGRLPEKVVDVLSPPTVKVRVPVAELVIVPAPAIDPTVSE